MSLQMRKNEIVRNYKSAKNPKEQIRILADLNCTSQTEIKKVLAEAGVELPQRTSKNAKKPINTQCEEENREVEEVKEIEQINQPEDDVASEIEKILHEELERLDAHLSLLKMRKEIIESRYEKIMVFLKEQKKDE